MSIIQANINTAMSLFNQNKYEQVVKQFSKHYQQHPMLTMLYAIALGKQQQYKTAFSLMDQLHTDFPKNVDVLHNHGLLLKECGKTALAITKHKDTLAINPSYEPAYVALGNLFMQTEQVAAAINSFEKAFKLRASASNLQGFTSALLKGKSYLKCIEIILDNKAFLSERVIAELFFEACYRSHNRRLIRDHYVSLMAQHENSCLIGLYTGLAEIEGKRYVYARTVLKQALTLSNDEISRYEIMSNYHYVSWLIDGSAKNLSVLESYLREQNSDQSKLFLHKIYEGLGRVTEAAAMLDLVSNHCKQSASTEFAKANILFRQHDLAKANSILENLTRDNAAMLNAYYLRIKVLEKMGDFAQAAQIINEVASISKAGSTLFSDTSQLTLRDFDGEASKSQRTSSNSARFIFIVGFPRSGTTLLEKKLLTGKDLVLMEETDACESFFEQTKQRFNIVNWDIFLNQASAKELNALADDYLAFLSSFVEFAPQTQILLDKMPLNFPYLPLMLAMFPSSQMICCIRDPRDIALSCLKFEEINLYSPKAFYQAYDKVFDYALSLKSLFEKVWHEVRYEDLVKNTDKVMLALCDALGLTLEVQEQSETLLQTPSYYQVSQPIYTSSIGLFDSYSEFIDFTDPLLDKWLKHWGYI
jgi:tetratricopeptide (TPR) repeat protein